MDLLLDAGCGFDTTSAHSFDQGGMVALVLVGICLTEGYQGVFESGRFAHIAAEHGGVAGAGMGAARARPHRRA